MFEYIMSIIFAFILGGFVTCAVLRKIERTTAFRRYYAQGLVLIRNRWW